MQTFYYDTIDSTNEEAKRLVRSGHLRGPAFILAREQTAGKGSRGRCWASPKDAGIYLTVVDRFGDPCGPDTTAFTLAAGVGCAEALAERAGVAVHLKPINDIYANGGKLGGILTETIVQGDMIEALMTGVGINISAAARFPLDGDGCQPASGRSERRPAGGKVSTATGADTTVGASPRASHAAPVCLQELMNAEDFAALDYEALVAALVARIVVWNARVAAGRLDEVHARWRCCQLPGTRRPIG